MKKLATILISSLLLFSCEDIIPAENCNCGLIVNTFNEDYTPTPTQANSNAFMVEFDIVVINECTNLLDTFHVVRFNSWVYVNTEYCVRDDI